MIYLIFSTIIDDDVIQICHVTCFQAFYENQTDQYKLFSLFFQSWQMKEDDLFFCKEKPDDLSESDVDYPLFGLLDQVSCFMIETLIILMMMPTMRIIIVVVTTYNGDDYDDDYDGGDDDHHDHDDDD